MLATDGYKLSMAEAGWPLRRETFYCSHRKGYLLDTFDTLAARASGLVFTEATRALMDQCHRAAFGEDSR